METLTAGHKTKTTKQGREESVPKFHSDLGLDSFLSGGSGSRKFSFFVCVPPYPSFLTFGIIFLFLPASLLTPPPRTVSLMPASDGGEDDLDVRVATRPRDGKEEE